MAMAIAETPQILIADDDEMFRRLLEYHLKRAGCQTITASGGREALELGSDRIDCALVDLKMPDVDGMAVLHHFRSRYPTVPLIMISSCSQLRDAVDAIKLGAYDYFTKPLDVNRLIASIRLSFGVRASEHRLRHSETPKPSGASDKGLVGTSKQIVELNQTILKVAKFDATVLITGENGVGKGVIAKMIHRESRRSSGPFVTASCGICMLH